MKSSRIQIIPVHCLWSSVTWMFECVRWFVSTLECGPTKQNLDYRSQSSQLHAFISFHLILRFVRIWSFVFDLIKKKKKNNCFFTHKRLNFFALNPALFSNDFFWDAIFFSFYSSGNYSIEKCTESFDQNKCKIAVVEIQRKIFEIKLYWCENVKPKPKRCECMKGRKEIHILFGNYSKR